MAPMASSAGTGDLLAADRIIGGLAWRAPTEGGDRLVQPPPFHAGNVTGQHGADRRIVDVDDTRRRAGAAVGRYLEPSSVDVDELVTTIAWTIPRRAEP